MPNQRNVYYFLLGFIFAGTLVVIKNTLSETDSIFVGLPEDSERSPVWYSQLLLNSRHNEQGKTDENYKEIPMIYAITATYNRPSRIADLTRLRNTLIQVQNLHWLVVEDGLIKSPEVVDFLVHSGMKYNYFIMPRPDGVSSWMAGTAQRNAGITWIRDNHDRRINAVFYFADDDNSYNVRIFEEMRYTKKISIWPVGLAGKVRVERPLVKDGKVIGFSGWSPERTFAVDNSGYALNVKVLFDYPDMMFRYNATVSLEESEFLQQCCKREELEPKADNCTKVLVWHTKTLELDLYPPREVRYDVSPEKKLSDNSNRKLLEKNEFETHNKEKLYYEESLKKPLSNDAERKRHDENDSENHNKEKLNYKESPGKKSDNAARKHHKEKDSKNQNNEKLKYDQSPGKNLSKDALRKRHEERDSLNDRKEKLYKTRIPKSAVRRKRRILKQ